MVHSDLLEPKLVPITGEDASVTFNPRKHRVLFWKWHNDIEGTLGFLEGLTFDPLHPIDQYTSALVEFISSSPRGSNVPWNVIKKFLGIASGEEVRDGVSFAACFPGLDSREWSKSMLADAKRRGLVGITIPSHTFEISFNQDGWIKFDIVNSATGKLLGWKATVPPQPQVDMSHQPE